MVQEQDEFATRSIFYLLDSAGRALSAAPGVFSFLVFVSFFVCSSFPHFHFHCRPLSSHELHHYPVNDAFDLQKRWVENKEVV